MGDEHGTANESENLAAVSSQPAAIAPRPVAQPPRPVSLPPRPNGGSSVLPSRPSGTPPPPPNRGLSSPAPSQKPPPPPARPNALATPMPPSSAPRPPPPSMRPPLSTPAPALAAPPFTTPSTAPASFAVRPPPVSPTVPSPSAPVPAQPTPGSAARADAQRIQALLSDMVAVRQELTDKANELRKVVSERNTLRARLVRAENQARELSSAARAEAQQRREFVDAHAATSAALRARIAELEAALQEQREAASDPRRAEQVGLRRIRGIGPAYERALLGLGITSVEQIARWSPQDIERIAPQIKARLDRIVRDDWVGQAQALATSE